MLCVKITLSHPGHFHFTFERGEFRFSIVVSIKKPDLCCKLASLPASPRICNVLYGRHGLVLISYKVQSRSKERGLKIHKQYLG